MRCEDLIELINDYLEGEMNPQFKEEFERHIDDCSSCLAFFETYKKTKELTGEISCKEIPDQVQSRIKDFLKSKLTSK
ncbi:MAG: zf-HC2 domain-containing protein [Deltaproteobacteria bacterium]|nr:zf-HC2 domain-containing protein [Deltaproteobacteria bacterium]